MGFGVLIVLLSGEIDISFVAIAALSSYATNMLLLSWGYTGGISFYLIIGAIFGALLGLAEGLIVTKFNIPTFFVSLGYQILLYGFTLFFLGSTYNFNLPPGLTNYYSEFLIRVKNPFGAETSLNVPVLYLLIIAIAMWLLLRYTLFGRGLYAIGGDREAAKRVGFPVKRIILLALIINGILASIAGNIQNASNGYFDPTLFRGNDLNVIAYVIIGGASILGGRGSVIGVVLGVIFIQVLDLGVIYMGISADWQQLFIGLALVIALSASTLPSILRRIQE
jgi:simple sugar transport system permease protein